LTLYFAAFYLIFHQKTRLDGKSYKQAIEVSACPGRSPCAPDLCHAQLNGLLKPIHPSKRFLV
jgi:hypothetical protein|tara:strand:- start:1528 stop:1716 length:189 start_codon:yes stop_codon:yes gene_type:complete